MLGNAFLFVTLSFVAVCFQHQPFLKCNVAEPVSTRTEVAMSPAHLNSRSTAADDRSDMLCLKKILFTAGYDCKLTSETLPTF